MRPSGRSRESGLSSANGAGGRLRVAGLARTLATIGPGQSIPYSLEHLQQRRKIEPAPRTLLTFFAQSPLDEEEHLSHGLLELLWVVAGKIFSPGFNLACKSGLRVWAILGVSSQGSRFPQPWDLEPHPGLPACVGHAVNAGPGDHSREARLAWDRLGLGRGVPMMKLF